MPVVTVSELNGDTLEKAPMPIGIKRQKTHLCFDGPSKFPENDTAPFILVVTRDVIYHSQLLRTRTSRDTQQGHFQWSQVALEKPHRVGMALLIWACMIAWSQLLGNTCETAIKMNIFKGTARVTYVLSVCVYTGTCAVGGQMLISDVTLQVLFEMRCLTDALHIRLAGWATALGIPLPLHPWSDITGALRVPDIFKSVMVKFKSPCLFTS